MQENLENKGCTLLNSYVLTVLLSIPFNKLPWQEPELVQYKLVEQHTVYN